MSVDSKKNWKFTYINVHMDTTNIFSLKNKVIVVTGGTGILGGAFVKGIANAGGAVVILGRNSTVGNERADEINASGGDAIFIAVDVLEEADLLKAKEIILEKTHIIQKVPTDKIKKIE